MRLNDKGSVVLIGLVIALGLLTGVFWYLHVLQEAETQHVLERTPEILQHLEQEKELRSQGSGTSGEARAAANARRPNAADSPVSSAGAPAASDGQKGNPRFGFIERNDIPFLLTGLLLTALTALGLAGSSYRLSRQEGRLRMERDRLARELDDARASMPPPDGLPPLLITGSSLDSALLTISKSAMPAIAYDVEAHVLAVSEGFTTLTGYSGNDLATVRDWFARVLRTPPGEIDAALEDFRSNTEHAEAEVKTVWTASGEERTWICQPLEVWTFGESTVLIARAVDVSQQQAAAASARAEVESLRAALREASRETPPDVSAGNTRVAELTAQLATREEESQRLQMRLDELQTALRSRDAAYASLQQEKQALQKENADRLAHADTGTRLLEAAYRAAGTGLCLLDADLQWLRHNERWAELSRSAAGESAARDSLVPLVRQALHQRSAIREAIVHVPAASGTQERVWRVDVQPITADDDTVRALAVTVEDITTQTQQTARLQEDAERFQLFAEQFEDSLWLADPRVPRVIYATAQAERLRGRPLSRMLENFSDWTANVHKEDLERVRQAFSAAAVEGHYDVEYRVTRPDGTVVWLHDRGIAVRDKQQRLRYIAGLTADITLRRNAEDMMRTTLARLQAIVDQAPASIWLKDSQGRYLYANREHQRLTQFTAEQLRGKTDFQVFPRPAAERIQDNDARALAAKAAQQFEESLQLTDGMHHFVAMKFPVRDGSSEASALCGMAFEVTERRRTEDAARNEDSRYRSIAAALPDPLLLVRESRIVYANAAAAELLGAATATSLTGLPLGEIAPAADAALHDVARDLAAQSEGRHHFPASLRRRDGHDIEVEISAATCETATERAVQFVMRDVTERNTRLRTLTAAERFFHELCNDAPGGMRLTDVSGQLEYANPAWKTYVAGNEGKDWLARVHPDDLPRVRSGYAAPAAREQQPRTLEYRIRAGGSRQRWLMDTLQPRHDEQGQWIGYVSTTLDISARKELEEALRQHRDDLAMLLDRCPLPIWISDANGQAKGSGQESGQGSSYVNAACREWLGDKAVQGTAVDLRKYVHPEDRDRWLQWRAKLSGNHSRLDDEFQLRRADGEYRRVRVVAIPVTARGTDARVIGAFEDVTEARRTARALGLAEQRRSQLVGVVGTGHNGELSQVRQTVDMMRILFPDEPKVEKCAAKVLTEAQRLEQLLKELVEPARAA